MVKLDDTNRMFSEAFRDSMAQMDTTKAFQSVETLRDNATALEGSCFCGKVHIKCNTNMPFPFMVWIWSLTMSLIIRPGSSTGTPSPIHAFCAGLPLHRLSEDWRCLLCQCSRREGQLGCEGA